MKIQVRTVVFLFTWLIIQPICLYRANAQFVSFELKVSPSVAMVFNTIQQYQTGLVQYNFSQLSIKSNTTWDLHVGARTATQNKWDEEQRYSNSGETPDVSILQLRFRNGNNTSQESGFFPLQDINNPVYIIGSSAVDGEIPCGASGSNAAGDYLTEPNCFQFTLDMLIKPGLTYRPGLYKIEVVYTIMANL
ncbi:MAG: hypothetical protein PF444_07750 [Bacteroidales bacterium]|nr:hypothetical protein [Bacteroidales bacterium]